MKFMRFSMINSKTSFTVNLYLGIINIMYINYFYFWHLKHIFLISIMDSTWYNVFYINVELVIEVFFYSSFSCDILKYIIS